MKFPQSVLAATSRNDHGNMAFKYGDEADVLESRNKFFDENGVKLFDAVVMQVEDADKIVKVNNDDKGQTVHAEAIMTKERGLVLFLTTADCLPIVIYDPARKAVALAHLGWKPTGLRLIEKVVREMQSAYKSNPEDLLVWIGPSIKKESYIVDNIAQKSDPLWAPFIKDEGNGLFQVDLLGYNKAQLLEAGVLEENIEIDPNDTASNIAYFSHYRAIRSGEKEGRIATIVALK